jgi:acyl carrier protein
MEKLKNLVSKVLQINIDQVDEHLSRDTADQWDSFNHLLLISEIEKEFGITFNIMEIEQIKLYTDLEDMVLRKGQMKK